MQGKAHCSRTMIMQARSRIAQTLFLPFVLCSCAGFQQAYNERVCWDKNSRVPRQCDRAYISLRCPEDVRALAEGPIKTNRTVVVRSQIRASAPQVGELFSQRGSIPIFVQGVSPWTQLRDDVMLILRQLGYDVSESAGDVLDVDIRLLDVHSLPAESFFDLTGTTRGTATFAVTYQRGAEEKVWVKEFTGVDQLEVAYALLKDNERVLGNAYCRALEKFAGAARAPGFLDSRSSK